MRQPFFLLRVAVWHFVFATLVAIFASEARAVCAITSGTVWSTATWATGGGNCSTSPPGASDDVHITNGQSITADSTTTINSLTIEGGTLNLTGRVTTTGNLTVSSGTLSGTGNITVNGGSATGNGTITLSGGTFNLNGTGTFGGDTAWAFQNLLFGNGSGPYTTTASGAGSITAATVIIASNQTLSAGSSKTWNLTAPYRPFQLSGTLQASTSSFVYQGTATTTVAAATYNNLAVSPLSGNPTYILSSGGISNGSATVDAGAVLFPLATIDVYNGDPDAGGSLITELTSGDYSDMGGGDAYAYSNGTLTRTTSGLLVYDNFSSNTIANYNTYGTVTISGGVMNVNANSGAIQKNSSGAGCVTARVQSSSSSGYGVQAVLSQNNTWTNATDQDGYVFRQARAAVTLQSYIFTNGTATLLGDTAFSIADNTWMVERIYRDGNDVVNKGGATALTTEVKITNETTYTAGLYGGVRQATNNRTTDWLDIRTSRNISVTGLPPGFYVKVSDGTTTAKAQSSGTESAGSSDLVVSQDFTIGGSGNATVNADTYDPDVSVGGDFTIGSNDSFTASASGGLTIGGSFANSGTFTHSGATVVFETSNAGKTVSTNGSSFNNVTLNKSGQTITLNSDATVAGTLNFTAGTVTTGSNKVIISSGGSISRTSGHVVGNLQMYMPTGATSKTFVIGDASNYTPIDVTFGNVSVAGNVTATGTASEHPNIGTSGIDSTKSVNRYWTMTNSGTTFDDYSATLNFAAGDIDGGANTGNFIVAKYDSGVWTKPTVGSKTGTSTQASGMTSFSDFVVGESSGGGGGGESAQNVFRNSIWRNTTIK